MRTSICLVITELGPHSIRNGPGSYYGETIELLSENGCDVVVLIFDPGKDFIDQFKRDFKRTKINIFEANDLCSQHKIMLQMLKDADYFLRRSHVCHEALQILVNCYKYHFDIIEFSDLGGAGFIPIRMKRNFKIYQNSKIIVRANGNTKWYRGNYLPGFTLDALKLDYMEKYSFEHADLQVSSSWFLLDWYRRHGVPVKENAQVVSNPVETIKKVTSKFRTKYRPEITKSSEVIIYCQTEEITGIQDFIKAAEYINSVDELFLKQFKFIFVTTNPLVVKQDIARALNGLDVKFIHLKGDEAIKYLVERAHLVVFLDKDECFPYTVLECLKAEIPFITSRYGAILEIIGPDGNLFDNISFESSNPKIFGLCLMEYLHRSEAEIKELLKSGFQRAEAITNPQKIVKFYMDRQGEQVKFLDQETDLTDYKCSSPMVTVIIPYYNGHQYFETMLNSLLNQTYKNFKIVLVNDGSTDSESLLTLEKIKSSIPEIRVLNKENGGPGSARNYALSYIDTKYIVAVDADNIAKPEMIESFIKCIENQNNIAALSCYFTYFADENEADVIESLNSKRDSVGIRSFTALGPSLPMMLFKNIFGDTNAIYRTDILKAVGGWSEERYSVEDWALWIKLITRGYALDVIPKVLFYYRDMPESWNKKRKMIDVDKINFSLVRDFMENNPEYFYKSCYIPMHYLIRNLNGQVQNSETELHSRDNLMIRSIRYFRKNGISSLFRSVNK